MCSRAQAANCDTVALVIPIDCTVTSSPFLGNSLTINSVVNLTGTQSLILGNSSINNSFINNGIIVNTDSSASTGSGVTVNTKYNSITNNGSITGSAAGIVNTSGITNTIISFTNNGTLTSNGTGLDSGGFRNLGTVTNFLNTGTISGTNGIFNNSGTKPPFSNPAIAPSLITTLTNTGTILGGIRNQTDNGLPAFFDSAIINTLNNLQGGSTPLTYKGALPANYNIMIDSPIRYGKLAVTGGVGLTAFGIHADSTVTNGTYSSVLTGVSSSNLDPTTISKSFTSRSQGTGNWLLQNASGSTTTWDLILSGFAAIIPAPVIPPGPSAADTQQSLVNVAGGLKNTVTQQNTVVNNSLNYDCTVFDKKNACVSVSTRNTSSSADSNLNDTSGVIVGAIRPHPKLRVGLYVDQNSQSNPQGNAITISNNKPLVGFFAVWNQNADDSGIQIKLSAANGQKDTRITRPIIGTSEAGSGSTQLTSQGIQITAKYGFVVKKKGLIRPYLGMRFTENNVGKYTEASSSSVTAPLSYAGIYTNTTTALAGVEFSYKFNQKFTLFASANLESDTNVTNGVISATGVSGLTPINLNSNPAKTRKSAIAGAYYDVAENQRIGLLGIYRQEPSQSESSTTAIATYHIGM